jgi:hypothetical protein
MLSDAILSIREAETQAGECRARRVAERSALTLAEEYSAQLEELLLDGVTSVPPRLARDIRRFVAEHERRLVPRLSGPAATLDALFDLQERLQATRHVDDADGPVGRVA